jgi:predicted TIM-barrel fold metal-dependent hydrolase
MFYLAYMADILGSAVQFHTGLGDPDLLLATATPTLLQPLIRAYPKVTFVLLHASWPFSQEAGYLAAMHKNVFLDFGEVFPQVSAEGQRGLVRALLQLCPTNKLMWSSEC